MLGVEAAARRHPGLHFLGTAALAPYTSIRPLVSDFAKQGRTGRGVAASVGTTNAQFNVALMATGLSAVDPRWNPANIMGKDLRALLPKFKTLCSVEAVELVGKAIAAAHGSFSGYKADWASNPRMKAFLAHNDPAAEPGFDLKKPTLPGRPLLGPHRGGAAPQPRPAPPRCYAGRL